MGLNTYVFAKLMEMSRSNSPIGAISSAFHSPFGCVKSVKDQKNQNVYYYLGPLFVINKLRKILPLFYKLSGMNAILLTNISLKCQQVRT